MKYFRLEESRIKANFYQPRVFRAVGPTVIVNTLCLNVYSITFKRYARNVQAELFMTK